MAIRNYTNTGQTSTLVSALGATDTTATLANYAGDPTPPFTASFARGTPTEEVVLVTAVSGSTVTITRGYDGTNAQAQGAGATFQEVVVAQDFREANSHVNATTGVHGLAGAPVGTTDAQTLTNKTLVSCSFTSPTFTGTVTGAALNLTTLTVTGATSLATLTVSGATTLASVTASGTVTLNAGATVPTGKDVTLTDPPAVSTDAVNKAYADGLGTSAATASTIARRDSAGRLQVADPSSGSDVATKNYVDAASATSSGTYRATASKTLSSGAASTGFTWSTSSGATGLNTYMSYSGGVFTVLKAGAYAYSLRLDSDATVAGYSVAAINVGGAAGGVDPALLDRRERGSGFAGSGQLTQRVTGVAYLPAGATLQPLGSHGTSDGSSVAYTGVFTFQYLGS